MRECESVRECVSVCTCEVCERECMSVSESVCTCEECMSVTV